MICHKEKVLTKILPLKFVSHMFLIWLKKFRIPGLFSLPPVPHAPTTNLPQLYPSQIVCWALQILQLFIVHIPAQSCQSTIFLHISASHSNLLWINLSPRAIQSLRHVTIEVTVISVDDLTKLYMRVTTFRYFFSIPFSGDNKISSSWVY